MAKTTFSHCTNFAGDASSNPVEISRVTKNLFINKNSNDKRVQELVILLKDYTVHDFTDKLEKNNESDENIAFIEPRVTPTAELFSNLPPETTIFGYPKEIDEELLKPNNLKYVCLSCDDEFVKDNNYLTALAMQEILVERFTSEKTLDKLSLEVEDCSSEASSADERDNLVQSFRKKILIIGWGKLTNQLEKVLTDHELSILNFNPHKVQELTARYGDRAYFTAVNLSKFDVIINTVPAQMVGEKLLRTIYFCRTCKSDIPRVTPAIYDLASEPYGFDWGTLNIKKFDYKIEPALPGRFYPDKAALAVQNAIMRHEKLSSDKPSIVLCITGSSCTYTKLLPILETLVEKYDVIPCLSENAGKSNRFTNINEFKQSLTDITANKIIDSITKAELLSSNRRIVTSVVFPATGNTIAKLANAITDTPVTMAVKALLRNNKPCIIGMSTNDALSGQAENIGKLLARKNYYFVPFGQDDHANKPYSCVCDFSKLEKTIELALKGKQIQPIIG